MAQPNISNLVYRLVKGLPLSHAQHDSNLAEVQNIIEDIQTRFNITLTTLSGQNINDIALHTGVYYLDNTAANLPGTATEGFLSVENSDGLIAHQKFVDSSTAQVYFRSYTGSVWTDWQIVFTSETGQASNTESDNHSTVKKWVAPDQVYSAFNQYGLGSNVKIVDAYDLDTRTLNTGFYLITNAVNSPDGSTLYLSVIQSVNETLQFAYDLTSKKQYQRAYESSAWTPWVLSFNQVDGKASSTQALNGSVDNVWMSPILTHSAFGQYGLGADLTVLDAHDADGTTTSSGSYAITNGVNTPETDGILTVHTLAAGTIYQRFVSAAGIVSTRVYDGASWSAWEASFNSSVGKLTEAEAKAGVAVNKWADADSIAQYANQYGVGGSITALADQDFDTLITNSGIYFLTGTHVNAPVTDNGFLQVVVTNSGNLVQNFTSVAGEKYSRFYDGTTWGDWANHYLVEMWNDGGTPTTEVDLTGYENGQYLINVDGNYLTMYLKQGESCTQSWTDVVEGATNVLSFSRVFFHVPTTGENTLYHEEKQVDLGTAGGVVTTTAKDILSILKIS